MKKFHIILISVCLILSCSVSDDSVNEYQELLPVTSVAMPETITVGATEEILISYNKPSNCHVFNDVYYVKNYNERTVAIISTNYTTNNTNCNFTDEVVEVSFKFKPELTGMYIFKFWQGKNSTNEDVYLTQEIEAIE